VFIHQTPPEMPHSVFIKGMVCSRCKMVVANVFKEQGLETQSIQLGEVQLAVNPGQAKLTALNKQLTEYGFELIDDTKLVTVNKVKSLLIGLLEGDTFQLKLKVSEYLSSNLAYEYHYLSNLFSETEGTTIEKYLIRLKVEKVKELIEEGKFSLSEISFRLGYSSAAHLTNQFKKVSGQTPTQYKLLNSHTRSQLEDL
jgi:AraC-like DNA-binding protein